MINSILNFFIGKDIILYDRHRQTLPLTENQHNKKKFLFVDVSFIWSCIPFKTANNKKHKIMYFILSCIQPKYILSMNWISKRESLYKVWTSKRKNSKFIVVQHGAYVGGIVTDIPHKYTKCDFFLTWGDYFTEQFLDYNSLKKTIILSFGNTIYNQFNRSNLKYRDSKTNKVLILPTALEKEGVNDFYSLVDVLTELNFQIEVKLHAKQGNGEDKNGTIRFPEIGSVHKITGKLYPILQKNEYDFIIADHSSSLLDAILFKNKVIYFDPLNGKDNYVTNYSNYLTNLYFQEFKKMDKNHFYELINIKKQEELFNSMVTFGDNEIDFSERDRK